MTNSGEFKAVSSVSWELESKVPMSDAFISHPEGSKLILSLDDQKVESSSYAKEGETEDKMSSFSYDKE